MALRFLNSGYFAGSVGIGTDNPSNLLTLAQKSDSNGIRIEGYDDQSSSYGTINITSGGNLRIANNNSTGSGYIQISAETYLELQAPGLIYTNNQFRFYDSGVLSFGNAGDFKFTYDSTNDKLKITTDDNLGLTMDNTGNVGIGTTSPSDKLHVSGGAIRLDNFYQLRWGGTGTGIYGHSAQGLNFYTDSGSTRLKISNNGNVGIGTTSPGRQFTVSKASTHAGFGAHTGPIIALSQTDTTVNNQATILFQSGNGAVAEITSRITNHSSYYGDLLFGTRSAGGYTAKMTILSTGNVGIGTTSPSKRLDIRTSGTGDGITLATSTPKTFAQIINGNSETFPYGKFTMNYGDTTPVQIVALSNELQLSGGYTTGGKISFRTATSEQMRLTETGLGIGTTSPDTKLDIEDSNPFVTIQGSSSSYVNAGVQFISNNASTARGLGNFYYSAHSDVEWFSGLPYNDNDAFVINRNASYTVPSSQSSPPGIGASAGTLLKVSSTGAIQFNNYSGTNETGTPTYILGTDSSGNVVKVLGGDIPGAGGTVTGTGTTNRLTKFTDGPNGIIGNSGIQDASNAVAITINGNEEVGINKTNPTRPLHVNGIAQIDNGSLQLGGTSSVTGSNPQFRRTNSSNDLAISTGGSDRITVLGTGNVGIGTTSPLSKFQVNGQASVLGNSFNGLAYFNGTNALASYNTANKIVMSSNGSTDGLYTGGLHFTRRALTQQGHFGSGIRGISVGTVLQDNALELYTSTNTQQNATRLKIASNGNVGIGTTSPGTKLQVGTGSGATVDTAYQIVADGSAISGIQILSGTNHSGRLVFGDSDNNDIGIIKYDHSDNSLQTIVNASEKTRVTSTGILMVGGTTGGYAGTKIHVGNFTDTQNGINILTSTTGYGYLLFGDGTGADTYRGQITYYHGDDSMLFNTNGSEKLRIVSGGGISFAGATNFGSAGQVLKSNGSASPAWVDASTVIGGPYLPLIGGTLTGPLIIDTAGGAEKMTFNNEYNTAPIADSFVGNTSKSYISFGVVAGSNDPGFIMHESSATETNEGVLHLCPSDDNSTGDYVSIHGSNDPDVINLHTSGLIETVNLQMQLKSGLNAVYVNDDLLVQNGGTFGGNLAVNGSNITLNGAYPRFNMYSTDVGEDDYSIINNNGTFGIYNNTETFFPLSLAETSGNATFAGEVTAADLLTVNGDGHLFLGADGETPKIDMMYDDHASGVVWDTRIFIGKTNDLPSGASAPTYTAAGGYGTQYQANSDGAFFGIIPYNAGNYRPIINWGDDATDTPFSFQHNGTNIVNISYAGTVSAPIFDGDHKGTINTATTAVTKANATNDTTVATTAFVQNLIGTIPAGLVFQGTWNAATNTPTLTSGSGTTGHFYIVSTDGSTNLDGITDWKVGDWAVFVEQGASDQWEKVDNSSVLDGSGTGQTIPLWSGSGNSNTLTNSALTQQSDDEVSILSTSATTGQNGKLTIYSYDDGDTDVKNLQLTVNNGGDANITNSGPYLNLTALNYIKSNNVHIFNEDMFMYGGKYIRFLDATSPLDSWNRTLGVSTTDVVQVGGIAGYNTGKGQLALFSNNVQAMYIDQNQMVGIGKVPQEKNVLDIQNDNTAGSFTTHRNNTGFALNRTYADHGNDGAIVEYQERVGVDGNNSSIGNFSNHNLGIRTNNQDRITILAGGNVGINSTSPPSLLDVQPTASNRKVTRIANDVMSTYFYSTQVDAVLAWTCGSYYQAEVVITASQTNGGTYNNIYIRGIWSNNHTSHHWDELERVGFLTGSTFTMSVGQNGATTNSGRLELDFNYISGSFSQLNVRVTDFYGTHSYTIT